MTNAQQNMVARILTGIASRDIDVTSINAETSTHGNVTLTIPGFPVIVVGHRGGVEAIGYRGRYGYASDEQVAVHADLVAATHTAHAYVRPTPKPKVAAADALAVNTAAAEAIAAEAIAALDAGHDTTLIEPEQE